ncbi:unnamed protein product [Lactuca saligna]|uniref:Uncharacterized protein n=1 Tax=Lactuca saligna TaxID=75948 RepID=A0AA36DYP8_LACSI|nr:unnamed protein product [Lactuca saligna]
MMVEDVLESMNIFLENNTDPTGDFHHKMSYLSRVFMTAGVAVANGHTDQGHKLKSGIKSFQQGKKAFSSSGSGADPVDLRPLSGILGSDVGGLLGGEERRKQSDDSLRQAMYMNCWGPS